MIKTIWDNQLHKHTTNYNLFIRKSKTRQYDIILKLQHNNNNMGSVLHRALNVCACDQSVMIINKIG